MNWRAGMWWVLIVACGGNGGQPPVDGAVPDRRVPTPFEIRASSASGTVVFGTDPVSVRVERADGSPVVTSASGGLLTLGTGFAPGVRYYPPIQDAPRGVTWHPVSFGLESTDPASGVIGDAEGRRMRVTLEAPSPGVFRMRAVLEPGVVDAVLLRMNLAAGAGGYYGLGERFGHADARGTVVPMQLAIPGTVSGTNEHHVPVPFFVSPEGYGVFVQTREAGAFDVASTDANEVRVTFESRELDVWFFVHDDPKEVIAMYTRHTGVPRVPPRWAFAPMHWRNEWVDRAQLEEDAARIRLEDIPCTTFWIDNPWQVSYNDMVFDETRFPAPQAMLDGLRAQGYVPLLWSTPYLDAVDPGAAPTNEAERLFVMARDRGWFLTDPNTGDPFLGPSAPGALGGMLDFTIPAVVDFWQSRAASVVGMGVHAFKLDFGEDILAEVIGSRVPVAAADGSAARDLRGRYAMLYHEPYRRALDAGSAEGGFLLVRASGWGGQTVADIVWPGDLDNDFTEGLGLQVGGLPGAITAMQSLAASGFPAFGSDTGGYRGGMPTREALLRWAEHTAFSPILQLGGQGAHHNPWLYDAAAGAVYRVLARAHMDLVPYFRLLALRAAADGTPPVTSPALAFPLDPGSHGDPYAYLLGEDIFVAAVVTPGATDRALHLPPGTWVHWFTGQVVVGPMDITVPAPIGEPPVFVRQGAVLPLLPPDLDTLIDVPDPAVVGPADRPYLRAWVIPSGRRAVQTEEGLGLLVDRVAAGLDLTVTPDGTGLSDLRLRIDLANAEPALTTVTTVNAAGVPVPEAATLASVQAGCDGMCWFRDVDTLYVSVRNPAVTAVQLR